MNIVKKVISLITIAIIVIRILTFNTFALSAAPVIAAEELTALLETALIGSGLYTESELEGKDYLELNDLLKDGINSGQINPKTNYYMDPISKVQYNLLDLLTKPEVQAGIGVINTTVSNTAVGNAVNDWWNTYWDNYWNGGQIVGEEWYDIFNPTYNTPIDMNGYGGVYRIPYAYGNAQGKTDSYKVYYFEYAEMVEKSDGIYYVLHNFRESVYRLDGTLWYENPYVYSTTTFKGLTLGEERYGDWRYADGTKADTDDDPVIVIGEADGTQVTPDMLNPDGTVTIGDTTYYPKDFIDLDKLKDPAIIDLLEKILSKLDEIPVVSEQDKPLVDVDSMEVDVPEELSDFTVPVGISYVFPFCLPFDFARGVKMLLAEPEVPVFKTEFDLTDFCGFDLGVIPLEISLEEWEPAVIIVRWFFLFLFVISLILISPKIVKGAG